jgi:hypothetical protein
LTGYKRTLIVGSARKEHPLTAILRAMTTKVVSPERNMAQSISLHKSYRVTRPDTLRPPLIEAVCKSARSVGTPFWLYETEPMRQRVRQLGAFDCIRFAQKANSNIHILRMLRATGVLVDAVSLGEIERALRAGYVPDSMAAITTFAS